VRSLLSSYAPSCEDADEQRDTKRQRIEDEAQGEALGASHLSLYVQSGILLWHWLAVHVLLPCLCAVLQTALVMLAVRGPCAMPDLCNVCLFHGLQSLYPAVEVRSC
jgi:hypothetical protein